MRPNTAMNAVPTLLLRAPLLPGYRRAGGLRAEPGGTAATTELARAVAEERRVFAVQVVA